MVQFRIPYSFCDHRMTKVREYSLIEIPGTRVLNQSSDGKVVPNKLIETNKLQKGIPQEIKEGQSREEIVC